MDLDCDVLVVGAGCGGVAAALAATRAGRRVVLTEPTAWVGGQLTSQAVPPDEHPWVETTGSTRTYRRMRAAVRARYRADTRLTAGARADPRLNPGQAWVSRLAAEPAVFHRVLLDLLAPARRRGLLRLLTGHAPTRAYVDRDRVEAVCFHDDAATNADVTVSARYVLDATEEGDLLSLTGCEHVLGAESSADTGEPHALDGPADPWDQQAITWCAALQRRDGGDRGADPGGGLAEVAERPAAYAFWRDYRAAHWPGPQLGWATAQPETGGTLRRPLFGADGDGYDGQDLWSFRRIRYGGHYDPAGADVTVVNWPQVDYWLAPLTGATPAGRAAVEHAARELTRCFVHWLQTEAPRPDGGHGHPCVGLAAHALGTDDGLAMRPYVREARRIQAQTTVVEQHVGVEARGRAGSAGDAGGAAEFADSVGVGSYRIDLHPSTSGRGYLDIATYPFQVPLGALLPQRLGNLLAAGKCLGVTHVTNGCYRLHPVEWNVGEAAGALAAFCLDQDTAPAAVRRSPGPLADFQRVLDGAGVQRHWPQEIRTRPR